MKCKECGNELRRGARFCSCCGAKAPATYCSDCGSKIEPGETGCPVCGSRVAGSLPGRESLQEAAKQLKPVGEKLYQEGRHAAKAISEKSRPYVENALPMMKESRKYSVLLLSLLIVVMQLVVAVMWTKDIMYLTTDFSKPEYISMHTMSEGVEYITTVTRILMVTGSVFTILAAVGNSKFMKLRIIPIAASLWASIFVFGSQWYLNEHIKENAKDFAMIGAKYVKTGGFHVLAIATAGSLILLLVLAFTDKKKQRVRRRTYYTMQEE